MIGQTFGHYRIVAKIGAGGMGEVYRAHDEHLDRDVALKVLNVGTLSDEAARKRFHKEALALAKLNHPNIETVFEFSSQDGVDFLAMELVQGESLDEKLGAGPMPEAEIIRLGLQFLDGLAAAHEQGIIHRDLKPANLFITPDGRVKILDFGLAKVVNPAFGPDLTRSVTVQSGVISGTVPYMSPEQLRGLPVDERSDIYSAGAVLYEMATGQRPFPHTQTAELMSAILVQPLPTPQSVNPAVSPKLNRLITKALERNPAARFQTVRDLRAALQGVTLAATVAFTPDPQLMASSEAPAAATPDPAGRTAPGMALGATVAFKPLPTLDSTKKEFPGKKIAAIAAMALVVTAGVLFGLNVGGLRDRAFRSHPPAVKPETAQTGASASPAPQPAAALAPKPPAAEPPAVQPSAPPVSAPPATHAPSAAPPTPAPAAPKVGAPANPEAARFYSDALARMRVFDDVAARDLLEKSVSSDPKFALSHAALAEVWAYLGSESRAREEAQKAFKLASGLGLTDGLSVEARYRSAEHDWPKAIETYRGLFQASPNLEYGLSLAATQVAAGKAQDALATVEAVRKLSSSAAADPRVDDMEAVAAARLGDYRTEQKAAARAAEKAQGQGAKLVAADARLHEGHALAILGRTKEALAAAEESRRAFDAAGDRDHVAAADHVVATVWVEQGEPAAAQAKFERALDFERDAGDKAAATRELASLAYALALQDRLFAAKKQAEEALASSHEAGDKDLESLALATLGTVLFHQGDLSDARARFDASLAATHATGNALAQVPALLGMSQTLYTQGDIPGAKKMLDVADPLIEKSGNKAYSATALMDKGNILCAQGDLAGARRAYEDALSALNSLGAKGYAAEAQVALARVAIEEGRPGETRAPLHEAIAEFRTEENHTGQLSGHATLARALLAIGNSQSFAEAQKQVNMGNGFLARTQDAQLKLEMTIAAARVAGVTGDTAKARQTLEATIADTKKRGFVPFNFEARLALGELETKLGKTGAARFRLNALEKDTNDKGFLLMARKAHAARLAAGGH